MGTGFVMVKTGGSHREMGVDFGRAVKENLEEFIEDSAAYYSKHSRHGMDYARRFAMKHYYPPVRRRYPEYLEEIRGIAEGSGATFEDVFLLTADEEISELWHKERKEKCSSAALWTRGGMYLLHNEDYPPRYDGRLVIVHAEPDDAPSFLSLTYPYIIAGPSCGMNGAGLAFAVDSLLFPPRAHGLLSNYVQRDFYSARKPAEIRRMADIPNVTAAAAVTVASRDGKAFTLEMSPNRIVSIGMGPSCFLPHTNHVVSQKISKKDERPKFNSRVRLAALEHLFAHRARRARLPDMKAALSSREHGLLRETYMPDESTTLASMVIDVGRRTLHVARRGPRAHDFRPYKLEVRGR